MQPNPLSQSHALDRVVGALRTGSIEDVSLIDEGVVYVKLTGSPTNQPLTPIKIPQTLTLNNGIFIGAKPTVGATVVLGVDGNNEHYFLSYVAENIDQLPEINDNELLIYANGQTALTFDKKSSDIYLGTSSTGINDSRLHINSDSKYNLLTSNFYNEQHLTQASRKFVGFVKRESNRPIKNIKWPLDSRIYNDDYDSEYNIICLDPSLPPNLASFSKSKNPPFVENREIVYEFAEKSEVKNEQDEASIYSAAGSNKYNYKETNRRKTKSDTLSLTLAYPNYLLETVKGTVVDIFGNILDLNRSRLPIGQENFTLKGDSDADLSSSYLAIRELERKSVAYHFEINARKDLKNRLDKSKNFSDIFGFDEKFPNSDYGRIRSRFFLDIDKEGQFKLNVPSSSEKGNIAFLTRYENFSTISSEDNNNPNKLIYNKNSTDVLQDSFACPKFILDQNSDEVGTYASEPGSITVLDADSPIAIQDRRYTNQAVHLKHGTAFHDILSTCFVHQQNDFLSEYVQEEDLKPTLFEYIPLLTNVVSDTIQTSGENANAGGRSGVINFDGSLEMSIGANTVDRQSLWLDTAGGIIANIGRDKNNKSAAVSMNGDVFFQIGGFGVTGDSRFIKDNNGYMGAALDLRVLHDGFTATMLRIDSRGVTIMTPTNINIYFGGDMKISGNKLEIDVEELVLQGRGVNKEIGGVSI